MSEIKQFSYNPDTVLSVYISMMRNMFYISSMGLALMTYSNKTNKYTAIVKLLSFFLFLFSIVFGVKASRDFKFQIKEFKKQKSLAHMYYGFFDKWEMWIILSYIYLGILSILCIVIFIQYTVTYIKNNYKKVTKFKNIL